MSNSSASEYACSSHSSYRSSDTPSSGSSLSTISDASDPSGYRIDAYEPCVGWGLLGDYLALPHNLSEKSEQWVESIVNDDSITTEAILNAAQAVTEADSIARDWTTTTAEHVQGKRGFARNFDKFKKVVTQYMQHGGSRNAEKLHEIVKIMRSHDVLTDDYKRLRYPSPVLADLLFDAARARTHAQVMPNAFRHMMHAGAAYANSERKAKKDATREAREPPGRLRRLMREARADARGLMMVQTHKRIRPGSIVPLHLENPNNAKRSRSKQSTVALLTKPKPVPHPRKTASRKKAKRTA